MLEGENVLRLEVNNRGGDPETQALVWSMVHSGVDLFEVFLSAARGKLSVKQEDLPKRLGASAVTVFCVARGYATGEVETGVEIHGIDSEDPDKVHIDLAGVTEEDGKYYTSGGRVFSVTGVGASVAEASRAAYSAIGENGVHFDGMDLRKTIAREALRGLGGANMGGRRLRYRQVL